MDNMKTKQLKIRVPADLLERWNALHKQQATSGSEIIRRQMEQYIQQRTNVHQSYTTLLDVDNKIE